MRIIVTGGAGFIGSNLARELSKEHQVTVIDDFSNAAFRNLDGYNGDVLAYDICTIDYEAVFGSEKIDAIFHQAALTDTTIINQRKMVEVNVNASRRLFDFAVKRGIKVIYASSAAVYGRGKSPMAEEQEPSPLNVYGFSKLMLDNMALGYMKKYPGASIMGLRYFNVFGSGESHKGKFSSMIWQLSEQMRDGRRPRIFSEGDQTRDHIYVKDVVRANLMMLTQSRSGIFNVGTGVETSFNEVVEMLNRALGVDMQPDYIENPYDFYQDHTCADITRLKSIGFKPRFSVEQGIKDYLSDE